MTCQLCSGPSDQKIFQIVIFSLCLFCWQTEQLSLAFCASEGAQGICLDSAHLCIDSNPQCPLISWAQMATSSDYMEIHLLVDSNTFQTCKGVILMGIDMSYLNAHLNFHRAVPHLDILLIGQISIALRYDHMASKKPSIKAFLTVQLFHNC